jgi:endoglucanase
VVESTRARWKLSLLVLSILAGCQPDTATVDQELLAGPLPYRGVSLSGAEWGQDSEGVGTNTFGTTYMYPDPTYVAGYDSADYYIGKGMTSFRIPFRWEALQPQRNQPFDTGELDRLRTTANNLLAKGAVVILDPHNYARYDGKLVGSAEVPNADFADLWTRLAVEFKGNPRVLFGLVNEPYGMPTEQWVAAANDAIAAIRATGATNVILVPGNQWDSAMAWNQSYYGTPNAVALLQIHDPADNVVFEAHQYLDVGTGGAAPDCVSGTIGSERVEPFTSWLRANGKKGMLGELGGGTSPTCLAAIDDTIQHIEANADVYVGWGFWAGGPWWGDSWYSLEPAGSTDKPQMDVLEAHLGTAVTPPSTGSSCNCGSSTGLVISTPLSLDKTTVAAGQSVSGHVTYQNCSTTPISLQEIVIAGRPPGGTHAAGPYSDLAPTRGALTLAANDTITVTASRSFTASDAGAWISYATYRDAGGVWHDGPDVSFTVGPATGGGGGGGSSVPANPIAFTKNQPFTTNSGTTNYVYVPTAYDSTHQTPMTLFVFLHGCGGYASGNIWTVSPGGSQSWISLAVGGAEGGCWNLGTDKAKVMAAIADIKTHFNIKPKGVIIGGYSSGGELSYETAFYNANTFAGVLVENSAPFQGSSQQASLAAAAWKFNVVHLAHRQDWTFPIDDVVAATTAIRAAGHPTTLIEREGEHWDNPGALPGTDADLATYLFPYLNAGWSSP